MTKRVLSAAAAIALVAGSYPATASAQNAPTIAVNGSPVTFDQPPIERAGRVYVPLRGVFEQLGASVVFANGQINATRGGTTVSLTIGNATATVNGQPQQLDSPPFVVGARTLVPLRFVAQALGANVSFDPTANAVNITQPQPNVVITPVPRAPERFAPPMPPAPPAIVAVPLVRPEPANGSTVDGLRPQISATFPQPVRADDIRIRLDGRDIATDAYVSDRSFSFDSGFDLPFGQHRVQVEGRFVDGQRFASEWTFANRPAPAVNEIRDVAPRNGDRVGFGFTVQGFTRPGSRVHIIATSSARAPFGEVVQTTATGDVIAGPNGEFARDIALADGGGGVIDVRIESRAGDGAVAVRTLRLRP